ncbi:MAG: acylphosphatase [archaeon]|jgi:acylphosphatase|nr:acylphosphatase [archaeon]
MPRLKLTIRGRVQGVGFRFFTSRIANSLGLKGFVRNLGNGCVEVVAEGSREMLEKLLSKARVGPSTAEVESTDVEWTKESGEFSAFGVKY